MLTLLKTLAKTSKHFVENIYLPVALLAVLNYRY